MASCGPRKLESNTGRDLISEVPLDIKERILEYLPTRDAARTALLSTHWNYVWLRHGRLVFDSDFIKCVQKHNGDKSVLNIINNIILHRAGPVNNFTLLICNLHPTPQQSDLDRWCRFLSRNSLQELNISVFVRGEFKLPSCIVSCRTIKRLLLGRFVFDLPINGHCIFPSVTSLEFDCVEFSDNSKGIVYTIPNLEKLAFEDCKGMSNFDISAPKLESLSNTGFVRGADEFRWLTLHLKAIKVLCVSCRYLLCGNGEVAARTFPTAINLQVIRLCRLKFDCRKQLSAVLQLLKKSPNLCELEIISYSTCSSVDIKAASRLFEDPNSCIIDQDLKMLKTIKIRIFDVSTPVLLFAKMLLSKSPALDRVVIQFFDYINTSVVVNIQRELLLFPRASPKAQIVLKNPSGSLCIA